MDTKKVTKKEKTMTDELNSPEAQEKIEQLKELLSNMQEEQPKDTDVEGPQPGSPIKGSDVNWDEYDLDPNYAHFYPRAELIQQKDTFKWVVLMWEFYAFSLPYGGRGLDPKGRPKGFAEMLTYLVNGPEGWQIGQVLPNGAGMGMALLQKRTPVVLPDPMPIETETVTEPITDEELAEEAKRAEEWSRTPEESNDVPAEHDTVS